MSRFAGQHQGSYDQSAVQDIVNGDAFQGPITVLTGTADAINPHVAGNYIINSSSADAITLAAPTAGVDDGLSIAIYVQSVSLAHTITATSLFAAGVALKSTCTPAQFAGAGVSLRAYNGLWHVIGVTVAPFS